MTAAILLVVVVMDDSPVALAEMRRASGWRLGVLA
jgi:hypothetical protein